MTNLYRKLLCGLFLITFNSVAFASIVGSTPGSFQVSPTGAATYSIPIEVPPGTNGMQPELSLVYNSQSGNGLLGQGWGLSGLSSITRCPKTLAQDGVIHGVDFSNNDRLCLDGQRLVVMNGQPYWSASAEYRTEIETFTRITPFGTGFLVETKDGRVLEYGNTLDAAQNVQIISTGATPVLSWAISKTSDSSGNFITYHYYEDVINGEHHISQIDYSTDAFIFFDYGSRPDLRFGYLSGSKYYLSARLENIRTVVNTVTVINYAITYEVEDPVNVSRLIGVSQCVVDGLCLPIKTFTWESKTEGWMRRNEFVTPDWTDVYGSDWGNYGNFVDLDGDGLQDFIIRYFKSATDQRVGAWINTGNGWDQQNQWITPEWTGVYGWHGDYGKFIDLDGDGLQDYVVKYFASSTDQRKGVWLNTGNGWSANQPQWLPPEWTGVNDSKWGQNGRYIDLNGDGLQDFIIRYFKSATDKRVGAWINTGNGWDQQNQWITPEWTGVYGWHGDYGKFIDLDGDGLQDYVVKYFASPTDQRKGVWLNTGNGWSANQPQWLPPEWTGVNDSKWGQNGRYIDLNGDGLQDFIIRYFKSATDQRVGAWINTGNGWDQQNQWITPEWTGVYGWHGDYGKFIDLDGDGLQDYVVKYFASSTDQRKGVWLNTGNGWSANQPQWLPPEWTGVNDSKWGQNGRYIDLNGDGLQDFIIRYFKSATDKRVSAWINSSKGMGFVIGVSDGSLSEVNIQYGYLSGNDSLYIKDANAQFPIVDYQGAMQVATNASLADGVGSTRKTTYQYEGLKIHLQGRGNLGFAKMSVTDQSTGITSTSHYSQSFPTIGMMTSSKQAYNNGTTSITLSEQIATLANTQSHPGVYFPYASQTVNKNYELNGGIEPVSTVTSSTSFDMYGNPTQTETSTTGANLLGTIETFRTVTKNTYHETFTNLWPPTRLMRTEVTNYLPGAVEGTCDISNSCTTRVSTFDYDPITGRMTQEVIEPGDPALRLQTDHTYDGFGNRLSTTVTGGTGLTAIVSRTTSTTYDSRGQYPLTTTNALGHTETRTWDDRFGVPLTTTGPNGITTSWTYDSFGRKETESRADGTTTTTTREWCNGFNGEVGNFNCPANGAMAITLQRTGAAATTEYLDKLGRNIRTKTIGFDGTPIYIDTIYNALGQVYQKSRPYFRGDIAYFHTFAYDAIGRPVSETRPDFSVSSTIYNGLTTSVTNALSHTTVQIKDVLGRLSRVTDPDYNSNEYRYDPLGNLIETEDAAGNIISASYNIRGQKESVNDPDMGSWSYIYNVLGELRQQTDAKGNISTNSYDKLGRLTHRIDAFEGISTWKYDSAVKGIGKPASSHGAEGIDKTFSYDLYGRPESVTSSIDGDPYKISRSYDSAGRLDILTYPVSPHYPTGLKVKHEYNAQGYLENVRNSETLYSYWQAGAYDATGNPTLASYGSGTVIDKLYDPQTGNLTSILATATTGNIQDLSYSNDAIGNLIQRSDILQGVNETFTYDNLNRLTSSIVSGSSLANHSFVYDSIGNIKSKTNIGGYVYGAGNAGPHAVSSVTNGGTTRSFVYDLNGNIKSSYNFTTNVARNFTWTSYNKPNVISQSGVTTSFDYGEDRKRFRQVNTTSQGTTTRLYIGSLYEKETSDYIVSHNYYIRAAGQTIGIYKSVSTLGNNAETLQYLHRDHLGSISLVTSATGQVIERLSYDSFGKRRNSDWSDATGQIYAQETKRSYTGHEYLDQVGIIHMNGRVYDPDLGRFMSADPFIKFVGSTQGLNRYSYTDNNPLSRVDPSGFYSLDDLKDDWDDLRDDVNDLVDSVKEELSRFESRFRHEIRRPGSYLGTAIQLVGAYYCGGQPFCIAAVNGTVTAAQGGEAEDIARSAAAGYVQASVPKAYGTEYSWERVGATSFAGGASAELLGGNFKDGFGAYFFSASVEYGIEMFKRAYPKPTRSQPGHPQTISPASLGVRPDNADYLVGIEGSNNLLVGTRVDGSGVMGFLEDYVPGFHGLGAVHDPWVRFIEGTFFGANLITNQGTIPLAYGVNFVAAGGINMVYERRLEENRIIRF